MKKIFFILTILLLTGCLWGQTTQSNWKNILQTNAFNVSKNKTEIPTRIVTQIADTITNIANPKERWDESCSSNGLPRIKLNWLATDGTNWIICYTTGGYSLKTIYKLISNDSTETIQNPGKTFEKFKIFKKQYLLGRLKRGSLY